MDPIKIDNNTLEITKIIPEEVIPEKIERVQYRYDFLLKQKESIDKDYEDTVARHAKELAVKQAEKDEIDFLLEECRKLNITGEKINTNHPLDLPMNI